MKKELKKLSEKWNASGEHNDTSFEGRYFINVADLIGFAKIHGLFSGTSPKDLFRMRCDIEKICDCIFTYDLEDRNTYEIIFNLN